jgi:hypothetical protein
LIAVLEVVRVLFAAEVLQTASRQSVVRLAVWCR